MSIKITDLVFLNNYPPPLLVFNTSEAEEVDGECGLLSNFL